MGNKLILDEQYLDEAIRLAFTSLVGEQMKRFEKFIEEEDNSKKSALQIVQDLNKVKKACKELAYEKKRELYAVIKAFNSGVKFIITPKTEK